MGREVTRSCSFDLLIYDLPLSIGACPELSAAVVSPNRIHCLVAVDTNLEKERPSDGDSSKGILTPLQVGAKVVG